MAPFLPRRLLHLAHLCSVLLNSKRASSTALVSMHRLCTALLKTFLAMLYRSHAISLLFSTLFTYQYACSKRLHSEKTGTGQAYFSHDSKASLRTASQSAQLCPSAAATIGKGIAECWTQWSPQSASKQWSYNFVITLFTST